MSFVPLAEDEILPPCLPPSCSPLRLCLAFSPLVTLLELPQPAAPQVLPGDEQAALVRHHAALPGRVIVCAQKQVLPPGLDLGAFAGDVLCAHPQQLVPAANAVLTLLVDGDNVDSELPPLPCLISFENVHLDSWWSRGEKQVLENAKM